MSGLYRPNVGIVVFNSHKKVWMGARAELPGMDWQFPQGGIDPGESVKEAAYRELKEETGITSVVPVAETTHPLRYEFPPEILNNLAKRGSPFIGQEQSWVLFYFYGNDTEIDFETNPQEIEFKAYEWVDIQEAPGRIIAFKRQVYETVAQTFKPYIDAFQK